MGIFHTLSQISKNDDKFKQWEQNQDDSQAKRDELNKKREHSAQEIKAAKDMGKTIIDVVDIMDQHSEDIAENVETVSSPLVFLAPIATVVLGMFTTAKTMMIPAGKKIKELHKQHVDSEDVKKLVDDIRKSQEFIPPEGNISGDALKKLRNAAEEKRVRIDKWYLSDKSEVERLKRLVPEFSERLDTVFKKYSKDIAKQTKKIGLATAIPFLASVAAFIGASVFTTKLQVDSSKVARFQARKILEDPKYFVNYTPEQIEEAREILKNDPQFKKGKKSRTEKLKGGMFKGLYGVIKDRSAYKKWKKTDVDDAQKVNRELSADEVEKAIKDKEVIQRVVRTVNNKAEIYSENMEVAANVIIGSTPYLGLLAGALVSNFMNITKIIPRYVDKMVKKLGSEDAIKAYENYKTFKEGAPGYSGAKRKFWNEFVVDGMFGNKKKMMDPDAIKKFEEAKLNKAKTSAYEKNLAKAKRAVVAGLTMKWVRRGVFGAIGMAVTGLAGMLIGLKLQKASSRAGRFVAKRELEEDPKNFIGYTEKDLEEVKNVKAPKRTFSEKLKENLLFLPRVLKQYFQYEKFKRTDMKKDKNLKEALTKVEVSAEQMKDAKNLQRKIFNTFERVDDKSQEYSESMEAAAEIGQTFAQGAGYAVLASPLIFLGIQGARGKLTAKSLINKLLTTLSGSTKITDSKWFKKYLNEIAERVPHKVQDMTADTDTWAKLFKGIDVKETPVIDIITKFTKNSAEYLKNFASMKPAEQRLILDDLHRLLPYDNPIRAKIGSFMHMDTKVREGMLNGIFNRAALGKTISEMNEPQFRDFMYQVRYTVDEQSIWKGSESVWSGLQNMPNNALGKFIDSLGSKDTIKKISEMSDDAFNAHKDEAITPLVKKCKEALKSLASTLEWCRKNSPSDFSQIERYEDAIKVYEKLGMTFGTFAKVNQKDFGLMHEFFYGKIEFLQKLPKMDEADFNRVKGYILDVVEFKNGADSDIYGKIKAFDQKALAGYFEKASELRSKIMDLKDMSPADFNVKILPDIKKMFEGLDGFESMANAKTKEEAIAAFKKGAFDLMGEFGIGMKKDNGFDLEKTIGQVTKGFEKATGGKGLKKVTVGDLFGSVDFKQWINAQEAKFSAMSDKEVLAYMNKLEMNNNLAMRLRVGDMDKAYVLDCISKFKKVIDKMPKEEMDKILNALVKEFNDHPDEFIQFVKSGKIMNIYKTPNFEKAVAAAGASWVAVNVAIMYTIETILADMQLKAGRLGVMKALDSLDDPAYYANIEVGELDKKTPAPQLPPTPQPTKPGSLFDMFKK